MSSRCLTVRFGMLNLNYVTLWVSIETSFCYRTLNRFFFRISVILPHCLVSKIRNLRIYLFFQIILFFSRCPTHTQWLVSRRLCEVPRNRLQPPICLSSRRDRTRLNQSQWYSSWSTSHWHEQWPVRCWHWRVTCQGTTCSNQVVEMVASFWYLRCAFLLCQFRYSPGTWTGKIFSGSQKLAVQSRQFFRTTLWFISCKATPVLRTSWFSASLIKWFPETTKDVFQNWCLSLVLLKHLDVSVLIARQYLRFGFLELLIIRKE